MKLRLVGVLGVISLLGCGTPPETRSAAGAKPAEKTPAQPISPSPAEPPLADFATGALTPLVSSEPIEVVLAAKFVGPDFEISKFSFTGRPVGAIDSEDVVVVPGATFAFVSGLPYQSGVLWIRRPSERASEPVTGHVLTRAQRGGAGVRYPFLFKAGGPDKPTTRLLEGEWLRGFGETLDNDNYLFYSNPASAFMARRSFEMSEKRLGRSIIGRMARTSDRPQGDLQFLMNTTTGRSAVQQAIQND